MDPELLKGLIPAVPGLLSPFVVWILGRSGSRGDEARIDYLVKRLDLIARLQQMQSDISDPSLKELFNAECVRCKSYMTPQIHAEPQSRIAKFFLVGHPGTRSRKVLRAFFHTFFAFFFMELLATISAMFSSDQKLKDLSPVFLFSGIFYLLLSLLFRMLAQRKSAPETK